MESPGSRHRRNASIKATRPRSATKGPLDAPDDAAPAVTTVPIRSQSRTPLGCTSASPASLPLLSMLSIDDALSVSTDKSFAYLLRPDIYHPLSLLNISPAFRSEIPTPSPDEPLPTSLATLENLLNDGHFLLAAHLSAAILTSSALSHDDHKKIFSLLYIRLACLELTGNTLLAAQEAKALEDLSSDFYYVDIKPEAEGTSSDAGQGVQTQHIVPWPLRVLAARLQSIGFGDSRKGISGLYELGLEARKRLSHKGLGQDERKVWKSRLADLRIRVVNTLIEMNDLDAARRSLANLKVPPKEQALMTSRMTLLYLKVGDVEAARQLLDNSPIEAGGVLHCLLCMAEGRYADAVSGWEALRASHVGEEDEALIAQNLAVCLLYTGKLNESRELLESLVNNNHSFQSLTFNLATIYELCSERSRYLKSDLTERVASQPLSRIRNWERSNADFKL
ncbi:uncharacterized protein PADG_00548 [Paracoccidioides brasiliensis Pb18]|uniref:Trafficking protein particle complex subunit 12 n=2 Tax=Paracoccidioides brasiliensis TaxID=121759 RepID=C1G108_PARBD|nr:uncharacterized protein PADG_00548 [Paracoccidioides brasiliensis Pb18]EEH44259.1 hypothetical protein PADG_00548 [Paracoccidioides brasiliensis Pb18]ODH32766.1 hypothetical protein ACO22_03346 [Paracoccidioides brasiliensis]ODH53432.1 hypothetical protein GX48_00262 [Paracoccidioides brasiliensis]